MGRGQGTAKSLVMGTCLLLGVAIALAHGWPLGLFMVLSLWVAPGARSLPSMELAKEEGAGLCLLYTGWEQGIVQWLHARYSMDSWHSKEGQLCRLSTLSTVWLLFAQSVYNMYSLCTLRTFSVHYLNSVYNFVCLRC